MKKTSDALQAADRKIYCIQSSIVFRPTTQMANRSNFKLGLRLRNLSNGEIYEFTGKGAYIWLLLDGVRTVSQVVQECRRLRKIKDKQFAAEVRKFLEELQEARLITEIPSALKNYPIRSDLKEFLNLLV